MHLNSYQKDVLSDLELYMTYWKKLGEPVNAFSTYWNEKGVPVGDNGVIPYQSNLVNNVPQICVKVPTGGGKTYIATAALRIGFSVMERYLNKAVVWLVPSDSILTQTISALKNPNHPYRQRLDSDFGGRVEVYSKDQLLSGENFSPLAIADQLSIFVLSYDSFRSNRKEGRKAYQENGNLLQFSQQETFADSRLNDNVPNSALINAIRSLNPYVVVDESHHATSNLSLEMLDNFNPSFILELTATPKETSNVISFVDPIRLKSEEMVKLPVIVYNRREKRDVISTAIATRAKLEGIAKSEEKRTSRYIRPIILFQAEPNLNTDSTTFLKVKNLLIKSGIPEAQIAIKTADVDELKGIDLLSRDCQIRFIITVNALKEGWDCPFAYILATIANRNSPVDVEQILGRVLRMPHTKKNDSDFLNLSYVITSSGQFSATLDRIVIGLNHAGFSNNEYRIGVQEFTQDKDVSMVADKRVDEIVNTNSQTDVTSDVDVTKDTSAQTNADTDREFSDADVAAVSDAVYNANNNSESTKDDDNNQSTDDFFKVAEKQSKEYSDSNTQESSKSMPSDLKKRVAMYPLSAEFRSETSDILLPQFFINTDIGLFGENEELLDRSFLSEGFRLYDKDIEIDFETLDSETAEIDISGKGIPKQYRLYDNNIFAIWLREAPHEKQKYTAISVIKAELSRIDGVPDSELSAYVDRIIEQFDKDRITDLIQNPLSYLKKIKDKVNSLLHVYQVKQFYHWLEVGRVTCHNSYTFPAEISAPKVIFSLPKTLYEAEEQGNNLERSMMEYLANHPNIRWWHRNPANQYGFFINGPINHYPDIIAKTNSGKIVMIETKGDQLENTEQAEKISLGNRWQTESGKNYRYYMVFETKLIQQSGSVNFDEFKSILNELK